MQQHILFFEILGIIGGSVGAVAVEMIESVNADVISIDKAFSGLQKLWRFITSIAFLGFISSNWNKLRNVGNLIARRILNEKNSSAGSIARSESFPKLS